VVSGSGTGDLAGLTGTMSIAHADTGPVLTLDWTL
jgi:Protein of unknown function (DUF3224)